MGVNFMVMVNTKVTLKGRLLLRLKQVGLTQADLAREMSINPQNISHWLERQSIPSNHLVKICELLKCSIRWLLIGDDVSPDDFALSSRLIRYIQSGRLTEKDIESLWPIIERLAAT